MSSFVLPIIVLNVSSETCAFSFLKLLRNNEKCSKQCLLSGVLYPCADGEQVVLSGGPWRSVSILLFSVMLTDKIDCNEKVIRWSRFTGIFS